MSTSVSNKTILISLSLATMAFATGLLLGGFYLNKPSSINVLGPPQAASEELKSHIESVESTSEIEVPRHLKDWKELREKVSDSRGISIEGLSSLLDVDIARDRIDSIPIFRIFPREVKREGLFVHLHGGAFTFEGGDMAAVEGAIIASQTHMEVISIDYRLSPEFPFPSGLEDIFTVYRGIRESSPMRKIAVGGSSAGGNLTLALTHYLKKEGMDLPAVLYLGTPRTDLSNKSDSLDILEGVDPRIPSFREGIIEATERLYVATSSREDPLISPIYGDFSGFPPTYLVTGTRDILLSDTIRVHRKLRQSGVEASLNVYEGLFHAAYVSAGFSPEFYQVYGELSEFLGTHLN